MYYLWERHTKGSTIFGTCYNRDVETDPFIDWYTGTNIPENILLPRVFICDKWLPPGDYPFVIGPEFLISQRIVNIFDEFKLPIIYYDAQLIQPNGHVIEGYKVAVIKTVVECTNMEKSKYSNLGPKEMNVYSFDTIVLESKKIPEGLLIFRLDEGRSFIVVHEKIKRRFEEENITGVDFVPLELT